MNIRSEAISGGHEIYDGPFKLAVVTTSAFGGTRIGEIGIHDPIPRDLWKLHWTKPDPSVAEAKAVTAHIDTLPDAPSTEELAATVAKQAVQASKAK